MKLYHPILDLLGGRKITSLFADNCTTLRQFCRNLEQVALLEQEGDNRNKFKGDMFELFAEFFLKRHGLDSRVGVKDYQIISPRRGREIGVDDFGELPDHGVDGYGKAIDGNNAGKPITVQVKYRHRHDRALTPNEGNLGNFYVQSMKDFLVPKGLFPYKGCMLVITTCSGLHYTADDMYEDKMRCIGFNGLRQLTDNLPDFWDSFKESILQSRTSLQLVSPIKLRKHQIETSDAIIDDIEHDDGKGRIILPTGAGKTYVQADIISKAAKKSGFETFVVFSPRIALSFQLLRDIAHYHISIGFEADYLNINSGDFDESIINEERVKAGLETSRIRSTTRVEEIRDACRSAKASKRPLVISCTYHSAERLREAGVPIDLQLNDEAHNVVSEEFTNCHGIGRCEFSFTATPKTTDSDDGLGMNNEELFGNVVTEKRPKELIEAGEILGVALHVVGISSGSLIAEDDYNGIMSAIEAGYVEHKKVVHKYSVDPGQIASKLLTVLNGRRTMEGILDCQRLKEFTERFPNVKILTIASGPGAYMDGKWHKPSSRTKDIFLKRLQQLKPTDEAIIMHINMLTEGIDVPGITGVMPLHGLGETSIRQLIGRAMRLWPEDRKRFYAGEISPTNKAEYIKQSAYFIVPQVQIGSADIAASYQRIWSHLYSSHGRPERVLLSHYNGINDEIDLENVNELDRRVQQPEPVLREWTHKMVWPHGSDIHESWLLHACMADPKITKEVLFPYFSIETDWESFATLAEMHKAEDLSILDIITMARNAGQGSFSDAIKKKFGTIYTPDFVVEKTVDLALKHYKGNLLDSTFCDPAVGDGNFLAYLYEKLMAVESSMTPTQQSYHILTKCLHGVEIIENMVIATKIRLLLLHLQVEKLNSKTARELLDNLNIHHGNAICLPADTEQEWYRQRESWEGGLLSEEVRERKFNVIVANPPYTHLRNLNNRRYAAYPKQRDMAQVFVRWALDHLNKNGACSFNTIDTWLDIKVSDGARDTRKSLLGKLREVSQDEEVRRYSENKSGEGGGDIPTLILCFNDSTDRNMIVDNLRAKYSESEFLAVGFLSRIRASRLNYPFKHILASKITTLRGTRTGHKHGTQKNSQFVFKSYEGSHHWLTSKCGIYEHTYRGNWKLLRADDIVPILGAEFDSEVKFAQVDYTMGKWLLGYLNTDVAKSLVSSWCRMGANHGGWFAVLARGTFNNMPVPDYDWYLANRPKQHTDFLKWVEDNMHDRDTFLTGINEQFEKLIK